MKCSRQQIDQLLPAFKTNFLKNSGENPNISRMLSQAQIMNPDINTLIYSQGTPITDYYFLLRGLAGLFKPLPNAPKKQQLTPRDIDEWQPVQPGKVIGQYFTTEHTIRQNSAAVKMQGTSILKIDRNLFDQCCHELVTNYTQIDKYAKEVLMINKKLNSFDIFTLQQYRLNSHILLTKEIGVIMKGECKIIHTKQVDDKNQRSFTQNHKVKCNLPSISFIKVKPIMKEVSIVCENQWIFTQNLEGMPDMRFKYKVTSENLILLTLPLTMVDVLSQNKLDIFKKIFQDRKERASCSPDFHLPSSLKKRRSPLKELQQIEKSPKETKNKLNEAHKILQKLDPNLNPTLILQKYKLGYNSIRYENNERKQRNTIALAISPKKPVYRLKEQYYKAKDWSQYVKLPYFHPI